MPLMGTFAMKDADEKLAARVALCEPDGAVTKKMNNVEALVAAATTAYFCGDKATLADVHLFCFLGTLRSGYAMHAPEGLLALYFSAAELLMYRIAVIFIICCFSVCVCGMWQIA